MIKVIKSGETTPVAGTYKEVGHGGGKVKNAQQIDVQKGGNLPELPSYTVKIIHGKEEKARERQHKWMLIE